ncbi:DEAD/DEAH box helicase [Thioalkalivibrio sp. HK1]|uniref:DEAD/DEAH box helicase n=1 Tax=Thioalkalivibrio sp. HK1 TaxID=1469245 RepID=UPI00046F572F|nr:DEAD/DEAH box helicase [Thioalkalivibrio sp. HK1]
MILDPFHPAVRSWFESAFESPTECQVQAWSAVAGGRHTLIAAPTGSGKTLAAFLCTIDALVRESRAAALPDAVRTVYVSPLKALGNDIRKNLETPLAGIDSALRDSSEPISGIRAMVRSGDTPAAERESMRRQPPHILVTTPESLYILLTSEGGRRMLESADTVIVDEIHALAGNKRGAHLALSLERLDALAKRPLTRIGLSATQRPIETVAHFLTGGEEGKPHPCAIVDIGHQRKRDLALELPDSPLEAVMSAEVWGEVYRKLCILIEAHRTTLVFVNTRRMAERIARALAETLGEEHVTSHHGSLSREHRLRAERQLKSGELKALVATASLELGIDIGDVDLVCQLGSTRSIATFLQRAGRAGHAVHGTPRARLFPLSRDDLIECAAILDGAKHDDLDRIIVPEHPLDVLAQQVVAMVAAQEWSEEALFATVRRAWPYRNLDPERWRQTLTMLADGFATRRGRRGAYLHRDVIHGMLRSRRGARLVAITSGGAIPDNADYDVILEPQGMRIGSLNEDFAIESRPGDVFQLGNNSWRIRRVEQGKVRVEDAQGMPPTLPFWLGEAPGRTDELSMRVCDLLQGIASALKTQGQEATTLEDRRASRDRIARDLAERTGAGIDACAQIIEYLECAHSALGALPDRKTVVLERFFDESGGMQLVIHTRLGSRINRAFGLALRKRMCRKFNFELQAAATEDAIVLSLGETHSFALADVCRYLSPLIVREVLIQALLEAPVFETRWRWNANISLAIPRFRSGTKVAPQIQRMQAEDLVAVVFPDQIACAENLSGPREVPDHPLVEQTIADALTEAMDAGGLERLIEGLVEGGIRIVARDLTEPSPLAMEILDARPFAFLDDAPLEERRTRAVVARRTLDPESAADIGKLDPAAIRQVRLQAWPQAKDADELHDALVMIGCLSEAEGRSGKAERANDSKAESTMSDEGRDRGCERGYGEDMRAKSQSAWPSLFEALIQSGRATRFYPPPENPSLRAPDEKEKKPDPLWCAAERLSLLRSAYGGGHADPPTALPAELESAPETDAAQRELIRARLSCLGPVSDEALADTLALSPAIVRCALAALESEGYALRGHFTESAPGQEGDGQQWCERRLLARIHRTTLNRLRREIEPASQVDFMRFLIAWQQVESPNKREGLESLAMVVAELEGFAAPAAAWEAEILPARIADFTPSMLDRLCLAGRARWARPLPPERLGKGRSFGPIRSTPIALLSRAHASLWLAPASISKDGEAGDMRASLSTAAQRTLTLLEERGPSFFDEIIEQSDGCGPDIAAALGELSARGFIGADGFAGLRAFIHPVRRRLRAIGEAGRWSCLPRRKEGFDDFGASLEAEDEAFDAAERIARTLLRRYGIVFKALLARENILLPWRSLLRQWRRLEARGEIRAGHFVAGFAGEQYALPQAIETLRRIRKKNEKGTFIVVDAADPLNLSGIVCPGERIRASMRLRIAILDGIPIATCAGRQVRWLGSPPPEQEWEIRNALLRRRRPSNRRRRFAREDEARFAIGHAPSKQSESPTGTLGT